MERSRFDQGARHGRVADSGSSSKRSNASGLSATRSARMHESLRRHVDSGRLPGLVALVSRH
ncbi:MAG TPA: hypothetical protein VF277_06840, partial [Steroidobacteraceae bacterium]